MDDLKLHAKNKKVLHSLVRTVRVFNDNIDMKFGIDKCATLAMKGLIEGAAYKYLGII